MGDQGEDRMVPVEDVFGVSKDELLAAGWGDCELCMEPISHAGQFVWLCHKDRSLLVHRDCAQSILADPIQDGVTRVFV